MFYRIHSNGSSEVVTKVMSGRKNDFVDVTKYIPEDFKSLGMFRKCSGSLLQLLVFQHWTLALSVHKVRVAGQHKYKLLLCICF